MRSLFLGCLCLVVGMNVTSCNSRFAIVKSEREEFRIHPALEADSSIIWIYAPYKKALDEEMNQVIGYTKVDLLKKSDYPESLLGNFFADAVWSQVRQLVPDVDFAMPSTKGGLRNDVIKGPITISTIFELMPFENEAIVFTLKGTDVQELLNFIAVSDGQPVAGLQMKIVNGKPEQVFIQGKAFDPARTYRVLTSDYIASGGDNARGFSSPLEKKIVGLKIRDALLKEVKQVQARGETINTVFDGRITKN